MNKIAKDVYETLCRDVEIIINALLRNQEDVTEKMFLLGIKYAEEIKPRR